MPWPEIPATTTKTSKPQTRTPTRPRPEDDWPIAYQENDHPFLSNEDKPGPSTRPPLRKSPVKPPTKKSAVSSPSSQNQGGEEPVVSSLGPAKTFAGSSFDPPPTEGNQSFTNATQEPGYSTDTGEPFLPVLPQMDNATTAPETPILSPERSTSSQVTPNRPQETITPASMATQAMSPSPHNPSSQPSTPDMAISVFPGIPQDELKPSSGPAYRPVGPLDSASSDSHPQTIPPGVSQNPPGWDPDSGPHTELQSPSRAPSPASPPSHPLQVSTMWASPETPEPKPTKPQLESGPPFFSDPTSGTVADTPDPVFTPLEEPKQHHIPNPSSYAPVPPPSEPSTVSAQNKVLPATPDANIPNSEPCPVPQPIAHSTPSYSMYPPVHPSTPYIPISTSQETMPGHPPSTVTGQSPDFPGEPSQTSARSLPDSEAPRDINPSTHHDKPTQFQEGAPAKAPMAPYPPNGVPPQPVVSASLDDEWVAAQNESQEEVGPTLSTTQADAKGQPWFPPGTSHLPNPNTPPIDWNLSRQQTSAPAKEDQGTLQANLEEHGNHTPPHTSPQKPDSQSPPSHDPGKGLPTEVMSGIHVVQNWPSTPSHKHSRRNGQGLSVGLRSDVQHATEASVEESEPFGADWSADEGLGPFRLRHPTFTGKGRTLFGIFTTNTVWTILSLGIYSFWGRVNIRRYLHSQTKFAGARFAFHGTGGELLLGWLKALGVFGTPYLGLHYLSIQHTEAISQWSLYGLAGFLVVCLLPTAIVGSHRYRMSRTSWRSIRFSFRASILSFTGLYLKGVLLSLLTLGIYYPIFEHARRAFLTSGTHFGNQAFKFDGDPKSLGQLYFKAFRRLVLTLVMAEVFLLGTSFLATHFRPNQVVDLVFLSSVGTGILVAPFLLGLWFWFQAAKQRFMWNHTTFGPGRFRATMKGRHLFELKCTNFILLIFSLGLAWPWVQKRNLQFQYYHLGYRGPLRLQHIVQQATSASPMGEELAGFFDAGFKM